MKAVCKGAVVAMHPKLEQKEWKTGGAAEEVVAC